MSAAVLDLVWCPVDRAVQVARVFAHRAGGEHVAGDAVDVEVEFGFG